MMIRFWSALGARPLNRTTLWRLTVLAWHIAGSCTLAHAAENPVAGPGVPRPDTEWTKEFGCGVEDGAAEEVRDIPTKRSD